MPRQSCRHVLAVEGTLGLIDLDGLVSEIKEVRKPGRPKKRAPALVVDDVQLASDKEEAGSSEGEVRWCHAPVATLLLLPVSLPSQGHLSA